MYPVEPPQQIIVDASQTPPGYPPAPQSTLQALLTAWDTPQPYNAGTRSAASPPATAATSSGILTNNNDAIAINCGGASFISISLVTGNGPGQLVAGSTITVEGTADDANFIAGPSPTFAWITIPGYLLTVGGVPFWIFEAQLIGSSITQVETVIVPTSGLSQVRARMNGKAGGQTPVPVFLRATPGAQIAPSIGQQTMANSQPVTFASDQTALPITPTSGSAIDVTDRATRAVGKTGKRPWDLKGFSNPAGGNIASVNLLGVGGKRITIDHITLWVINANAGAQTPQATVSDGGTTVWGWQAFAPAGNHDGIVQSDLALQGGVGNSMLVSFASTAASMAEVVDVGAYLD